MSELRFDNIKYIGSIITDGKVILSKVVRYKVFACGVLYIKFLKIFRKKRCKVEEVEKRCVNKTTAKFPSDVDNIIL